MKLEDRKYLYYIHHAVSPSRETTRGKTFADYKCDAMISKASPRA